MGGLRASVYGVTVDERLPHLTININYEQIKRIGNE